jgi:hypothetical protein
MHFQFEVASQATAHTVTPQTLPPNSDAGDLLRQILEVQREQLNLTRQRLASQDAGGRWRTVLARWGDDFADLPSACRTALPQLERAYIALIADLAENLRRDNDDDALDNEFSLSEFLDRYGSRLNQLGAILHLVGPLAELADTKTRD